MPMFQENQEQQPATSPPDAPEGRSSPIPIQSVPDFIRPLSRRISEESIRTELCDGPILEIPTKPVTPERNLSNVVSDRAELIERLKRGESPTWVPNRHLESLFHQDSPPRTPVGRVSPSPALLPAPDITPEKQPFSEDPLADIRLEQGLHIERPRSALHSGNFTPEEAPVIIRREQEASETDIGSHFVSTESPWIPSSPPRDFNPFEFGRATADYRKEAFKSGISSISSSLSSSFVYKPPTSPLVQSESNEDLDLSLPLNSFNIAADGPRNPRRHTLHFAQHSPYSNVASQKQTPLRRDITHPYQAHQPRRSLNLSTHFSPVGSSPQTPALFRARRPSIGSDVSPLQHASMVGSYEESILRGRMSTTPSKPLEFMAQIGVLGLGGNCKSSLRCPAHVTLPFSAVFYSYSSTSYGRSKTEDGPSPYVGQIDLENGLTNPDNEQRTRRKLQTRYHDRKALDDSLGPQDDTLDCSEGEVRKPGKHKRQSRSPRAPPGGRYRIPEKGQLQIIIKNQNKTAVKLFLIPYDLAGMEPATKTFIRQRSYSAGPIIENVPDIKDIGTGDRPILRYLIHLHICCPSKGRYYLYKSIRVVFANRVPDGKERLRNEITYPEPRFSPYKPIRVMPTGSGGPTQAAEQAFRRRSSGFSFAGYSQFGSMDGMQSLPTQAMSGAAGNVPVDPVPYGPRREGLRGTASNGSTDTASNQDQSSDPAEPPDSWQTWQEEMRGVEMSASPSHRDRYGKLSRGDVGYGGNAFALAANSRLIAPEGLLSQRLRSLGMQGYLSDDDGVVQPEE